MEVSCRRLADEKEITISPGEKKIHRTNVVGG